jgi:hypothetical protein
MVYNDENGQEIRIQPTSHATLAPKGKGNFRLCINYVYLNHQLHRHIWEIRNLEECVRRQAGNLRFSGVDGFSGFFAVLMGKNKHLTAFVIVGWGIFIWNFLPFGLQGGPSTYSRLIWKAFVEFVGDNLQVTSTTSISQTGRAWCNGRTTTPPTGSGQRKRQLIHSLTDWNSVFFHSSRLATCPSIR